MTERKKKQINGLNKKIVVLDFETTGFSTFTDEVTEIGAVALDGKTFEVTGIYDTLIKVQKEIPQKVVELTGITNEMTNKHGVPFDVAKAYLQAMTNDAVIVAHNAPFDFQFLDHQFDIRPELYYDTLTLSRLHFTDAKSHKLGDVCKRIGVTLTGAHRAINDVYATVEVLKHFLFTEKMWGQYNVIHPGTFQLKYKPNNTRKVVGYDS